jgi:hypothetical protein
VGVVFTGIGALGYRRRFDASAVKEVRIEDRHWRDSAGDRQRKACILIETREGKQAKLGSMLTPEHRERRHPRRRRAGVARRRQGGRRSRWLMGRERREEGSSPSSGAQGTARPALGCLLVQSTGKWGEALFI